MRRLEVRNSATARAAPRSFSEFVGAPVVHAGHAGVELWDAWFPLPYDGHFQGAR